MWKKKLFANKVISINNYHFEKKKIATKSLLKPSDNLNKQNTVIIKLGNIYNPYQNFIV